MRRLVNGTPMMIGKTIFTRKQTARMLGLPEEVLHTYVRRSDVIVTPKKDAIEVWDLGSIESYLWDQELVHEFRIQEIKNKRKKVHDLWAKYCFGY